MITISRVIVIALSLIVFKANAQDFQGVATYKTKRKVDLKMDSTQVSSEMQDQMMEMLKKQFEKTYTLTFDATSSIYKEEESLSKPQMGGVQVMMFNTGGADILYKNIKEERYTNQNDVYGKIFLVKDTLNAFDWKLEGETKHIGEYTCYKATFTREIEVRESGISFNGDKDLNEREVTKKTQVVTAWYTPQIPVNNGPESYYGLPGLILEINDGQQTIICSKIVLNPKEKVEIKEPKKGKKVSQDAFNKIMEKKMKEMEERYRPRDRDKSDGQTFEIRIGG